MRWWMMVGAVVAASTVACGMQASGGPDATNPTAAATPTSTPSTAAGTGGVFNILDFGAVADGKTFNTAAIQKAIDACGNAGGGRVLVPAGVFRTGPIRLVSHLDLHLAAGAKILFSDNRDDYPMMIGNFEGKAEVVCQSPLSGDNLQWLSITGEGTFDGSGQVWWPVSKLRTTEEQWKAQVASGGVVEKVTAAAGDMGEDDSAPKDKTWWPSRAAMDGQKRLAALRRDTAPPKLEDYKDLRDLLRPPLVTLTGCTNLTLDGCTFSNSPVWTIHMLWCKDVMVRNISSLNPIYGRNTDGLDIDSCNGVVVTGSTINSGDDDICIKSGLNEEDRKRGQPCENITIDNCVMGTGHGGVAIGSEISGGVRNVTVSNCVMRGTETGLRFKSRRGRGGLVENITMTNITMYDIKRAAIGFDLFYKDKTSGPQAVNESTPIFRQITLRNITCRGAKTAIEIHGLAEMPLSDVTLDHVNLTADGGATIENAKNIVFRDVEIHSRTAPALVMRNVSGMTTDQLTATAEDPLAALAPATRPSKMSKSSTRPAAAAD